MPEGPRISAAQVALGRVLVDPVPAPDGSAVALVVVDSGRARVVVVPTSGGPELTITSVPAPRRAHPSGGGVLSWFPDGRSLAMVADDGDLWRVGLDGSSERLTTGGLIASPAVHPDGTRVAVVIDERHVAIVSGTSGGTWPVRVGSADFAIDPSWAGDTVVWHEWDGSSMPWDASRIVAGSPTQQRTVLAGGDDEMVAQPRHRPGTDQILYVTDRSGHANLWTVGLDGSTPAPVLPEPFEHAPPSWGPGIRSFAPSPDGTKVAVVRNERGFGRLVEVDLTTGTATDVAKAWHVGVAWAGPVLTAIRTGGVTPNQVVAYDTSTWERRTLLRGPLAGFEGVLAEPELAELVADDGVAIPARLYRPTRPADPAAPAEPPPMIVQVHGGPTDQATIAFNGRIGWWCERGWSVLVPDHRGSTGHGRAFRTALDGRWGELDADDVAAAARDAVSRGWAHPNRVVVSGGSAGGFAALCALARHPEVFAAGVALYPVTDLVDLDETTHRFEASYCRRLIGPRPAASAAYRARSPIELVDRICAPVLLLHGSRDVVVEVSQSTRLAAALAARGRIAEVHVYEDEGHGWSRPSTVIDELERSEAFLARHVLRGRA